MIMVENVKETENVLAAMTQGVVEDLVPALKNIREIMIAIDIYFQVKNEVDILQTLATDETIVQAIIAIDTAEMISEMESLGQADLDLGMDELDVDDSDFDDDEEDEDDDSDDSEDEADDENEWVSILDEEDQEEESDGSLGDWAKLETMRSSLPIYFAKKLEETSETCTH